MDIEAWLANSSHDSGRGAYILHHQETVNHELTDAAVVPSPCAHTK